MQGVKSANSKLFKDFCNEAEMKKNKTDCIIFSVIAPKKRNHDINFLLF